ncbi:MAG: N-acetylmuramoyl-L-alanine amidase [Clostridiales bacterium]|nr:N-acetylmuramoyl-L-alanine amidase [Clostridiales bacterium]
MSNSGNKCIVIDAGHGGADAGTVAADGSLEKNINLGIALDLYDFLSVCGIPAKTIRNNDSEYYPNGTDRSRSDLYNRLDFVNSVDNSVLVSIHQNHFTDTSEWGMQVWYTANESSSKNLADNILNISKNFLQPENQRLNKQSDNSYYILYKASVPSVMVECGFMSNPDENERLNNDEYRRKLGYTIMLGINEYLNGE